jgi:dipeptidyl aminopeptidase/acylaminoacyl peptidase
MEDGAAYVAAFFGGSRTSQPAAYAAGDPFTILLRWPADDPTIPILLVHATNDTVVSPAASRTLHTALIAAGYPNRLLMISGSHGTAIRSSAVVDAIMRLAP